MLPAPPGGKGVTAQLLDKVEVRLVQTLEVFTPSNIPAWAAKAKPVPLMREVDAAARDTSDQKAAAAWAAGLVIAAAPHWVPISVTSIAHAAPSAERSRTQTEGGVAEEVTDLSGEQTDKTIETRHGKLGPVFGLTVHKALELVLRGTSTPIPDVVRACAAFHGLTEHVDDAIADVQRGVDALEKAGLCGASVVKLHPEFSVSAPRGKEQLVVGIIDLAVETKDGLWLVDFKTDPAPKRPVNDQYPAYVEQVKLYAGLIEDLVAAKKIPVRAVLLFTAMGALHQVL